MTSQGGNHASDRQGILARQGLRLPAATLKQIRAAGIYCQPSISIEHQHLAKRYVLRGMECGGAVADIGAYSSFVDDHGNELPWLQRVDSIAVNGVHAVAVAPILIRLEMVRIQRTYDLLITRHFLEAAGASERPRLGSSILFYGRRGSLEMELWGKDTTFRGAVCPVFYARSGEAMAVPTKFQEAVTKITDAVCCIGCRDSHLLSPRPEATHMPDTSDAALGVGSGAA
jgi:hypothetical protein